MYPIKVSSYQLKTKSGKHIRIATQVVFGDDRRVRFTEKLPKYEAIKQAIYQMNKDSKKEVI